MAACFAGPSLCLTLAAMASFAAHRSRRHRQPLFEGPVLFRRSRMSIVELFALVWLLAKIAPLARSFFARRGEASAID